MFSISQVDWHVAEETVAERLRAMSIEKEFDDVVTVIHTPAQ